MSYTRKSPVWIREDKIYPQSGPRVVKGNTGHRLHLAGTGTECNYYQNLVLLIFILFSVTDSLYVLMCQEAASQQLYYSYNVP